MHGGIAHDGNRTNMRFINAGLLAKRLGQLGHGLPDGIPQETAAFLQNMLDPGNYIRTELSLGILAAGGGGKLTGMAVHEVGHHCGGADIESQDVRVFSFRSGRNIQTGGEDLFRFLFLGHHSQIPVNDGLTGQNFATIDDNLTFSAGAFATAGSIGMQSGGDLRLEYSGTGFCLYRNMIRQECYGMQIHIYTSNYDRKGPMLPSAPSL